MPEPSFDQQITLAREYLLRDRAGDALRLLDHLGAANSDRADVVTLRAVALANSNQSDEATREFQRVIAMEPEVARYRFNLAAQHEACGEFENARSEAIEALRLDPSHAEAQGILTRLDPANVPPTEPKPERLQMILFGDQELRGPTNILGLGEKWTWLGYGLFGLALMAAVLFHFHFPLELSNFNDPKLNPTVKLRPDLLSTVAVTLYVGSTLLSFMWLTVDVVDRRARFVWLLPMFVFSFCGYPVIPFALYLRLGRNSS